jgi:hypothetical protein
MMAENKIKVTPETKDLDADRDGYIDEVDLIAANEARTKAIESLKQSPLDVGIQIGGLFSSNPLTIIGRYAEQQDRSQTMRSIEELERRQQRIEQVLQLTQERANEVRNFNRSQPQQSNSSQDVTMDTSTEQQVMSEAKARRDQEGNTISDWLGMDILEETGKIKIETKTFTKEELANTPYADQDSLTQRVAYALIGDDWRLIKYKRGDDMRQIQYLSRNLKDLYNFREMAYIAGFYGDTRPGMTGTATMKDVEVMRKVMLDSNITGSDWSTYIKPLYEKNAKYGRPMTEEEAAKFQLEQDRTGKSAVKELQMYGMDNNINLSGTFLYRKQKEIVDGLKTVDDVKQEIRDVYLKTYYPSYANDLDRGMTIKELIQPYTDVLATTLEIPEPDNPMSDNLIKQVLAYKDEKGMPAKMPIWQFEQMVKEDERWQYTDNAYRSMRKAVDNMRGRI